MFRASLSSANIRSTPSPNDDYPSPLLPPRPENLNLRRGSPEIGCASKSISHKQELRKQVCCNWIKFLMIVLFGAFAIISIFTLDTAFQLQKEIEDSCTQLEDVDVNIWKGFESFKEIQLDNITKYFRFIENKFRILRSKGYYNASNGNWYKISNDHLKYTEARDRCVMDGAQLASTGLRIAAGKRELIERAGGNVWVGLDTLYNGDWKWADNVPATRDGSNWVKRTDRTNKSCAFISETKYKFDYTKCAAASKKYMCEYVNY